MSEGDKWNNLKDEWGGLRVVRQMNHCEKWLAIHIAPKNREYWNERIKGVENPTTSLITGEEGMQMYDEYIAKEGIDEEDIKTGRVVLHDSGVEYFCPTERDKPEIPYKEYLRKKSAPEVKTQNPSL